MDGNQEHKNIRIKPNIVDMNMRLKKRAHLKILRMVILYTKEGSQTKEEIEALENAIRDAGYAVIITSDTQYFGKMLHAHWSDIFALVTNDFDFLKRYRDRRLPFIIMYRKKLILEHIRYDLTHSSVD